MKNNQFQKLNTVLAALAVNLIVGGAAMAASVSQTAPNTANKTINVGNYQFSTNLWGVASAGSAWYEEVYTNSTTGPSNSGWKWTGFVDANSSGSVKAYPSIRRGASNSSNVASASGLPYLFGSNTKNVDVIWDFTPTGYNGTGSISGAYNHAIDVFFRTNTATGEANIRGEIMIIPESSANSQTSGWGTKDAAAFVIDGETWDVWRATMSSNGYSWPVIQFRKRVMARYFQKNLKNFFAEAKLRMPSAFASTYYVSMIEAGTEIKHGSGKVHNTTYSVSVY